MKVFVKNRLLEFDELPPLEPISINTTFTYWLLSNNMLLERRQITRTNVIEDLYQVLDRFEETPSLTIHTYAHTPEYNKLVPIINKGNNVGRCKNAWCCYDALTGNITHIYPNVFVCAEELHINCNTIYACNLGRLAIIHYVYIIANHYISPEELNTRKETAGRNGPNHSTRIYVYDYDGSFVGSFLTIADAARTFKLNHYTIRTALIDPSKRAKGYYFYTDPNMRPPIK